MRPNPRLPGHAVRFAEKPEFPKTKLTLDPGLALSSSLWTS